MSLTSGGGGPPPPPPPPDAFGTCMGHRSSHLQHEETKLRVDTIYPGSTVRGNSGSFKP